MKKKFILAIAALCAFVVSCSSDDYVKESETMGMSNDAVHELLKDINDDNPLSTVGTLHNEVLSAIIGHVERTRSVGDSVALYNSIRTSAINEYIATGDTSVLSVPAFEVVYDTVASTTLSGSLPAMIHTGIHPVTHGTLVYSCMSELDNIFDDNDDDINSLLQRVQYVQNMAKGISSENDKNMVMSCASIAANSLEYWSEQTAEPYQVKSGKEWKRIAKDDVKAGKKAHSIFGNSFWGWVGTAIVAGGASAISYYF